QRRGAARRRRAGGEARAPGARARRRGAQVPGLREERLRRRGGGRPTSWHALCFCCRACGKSLRGGQYREHDGWPYCEADHGKLFGPKGIGFGGTMGDTGVAAPAAAEAPEAT
ncbi:unnamed protein product, partial [Prorocentrum cordatum]